MFFIASNLEKTNSENSYTFTLPDLYTTRF